MRVLEKILAQKLKLFKKKSKCFIAKDSETTIQHCSREMYETE